MNYLLVFNSQTRTYKENYLPQKNITNTNEKERKTPKYHIGIFSLFFSILLTFSQANEQTTKAVTTSRGQSWSGGVQCSDKKTNASNFYKHEYNKIQGKRMQIRIL